MKVKRWNDYSCSTRSIECIPVYLKIHKSVLFLFNAEGKKNENRITLIILKENNLCKINSIAFKYYCHSCAILSLLPIPILLFICNVRSFSSLSSSFALPFSFPLPNSPIGCSEDQGDDDGSRYHHGRLPASGNLPQLLSHDCLQPSCNARGYRFHVERDPTVWWRSLRVTSSLAFSHRQ